MRKPVGNDGKRVAGHEIGTGSGRVADDKVAVFDIRGPDIDAYPLVLDVFRSEVGILQGPPDQLQDPSLLRVKTLGFARRNSIHRVVDVQGVWNNACLERVGLAEHPHLRVPVTSLVPTLIGNFGNSRLSFAEQFEEFLRGISSRNSA